MTYSSLRNVYAVLCYMLLFLSEGESQIVCPNIAELGSPASLTCIVSSGSDNIYFTPRNQTAATCFSNLPPCETLSQFGRFSGTVINTSHSNLRINETWRSDEGEWICRDTSKKTESNCTLVLSKTPTCNITSDRNTDTVYAKDEITLTVQIGDHYCSFPAGFDLRTGQNTMKLLNKNNVFNSTFKLTDSHFGPVDLLFTCNHITRSVKCGNVQRLVKHSQPAKCSHPVPLSVVLMSATGSVVLAVVGTAVCIYLDIRKKKSWNERYAAYLNPLGNRQSHVSDGHASGTSDREENESVIGSHEYVSINDEDVSLD